MTNSVSAQDQSQKSPSEDLLKPLNPSIISVAVFLLFLLIHIVATYSMDGVLGFPFPNLFRFSPPTILEMIFQLFWRVISLPLVVLYSAISYVFQALFRFDILKLFNSTIVFVGFVIYYYFLACALAIVVKK